MQSFRVQALRHFKTFALAARVRKKCGNLHFLHTRTAIQREFVYSSFNNKHTFIVSFTLKMVLTEAENPLFSQALSSSRRRSIVISAFRKQSLVRLSSVMGVRAADGIREQHAQLVSLRHQMLP